jgi:hypothetical protein
MADELGPRERRYIEAYLELESRSRASPDDAIERSAPRDLAAERQVLATPIERRECGPRLAARTIS